MNLDKPSDNEAPIVSLLQNDIASMTDEQLEAHSAKLRIIRGVPAQRQAALTKSKRSVKTTESGVNLSELL